MKNILIAVFAATLFFQTSYSMKRELTMEQTKPTHSLLEKYVPRARLVKKLAVVGVFSWLIVGSTNCLPRHDAYMHNDDEANCTAIYSPFRRALCEIDFYVKKITKELVGKNKNV